MSAHEEINFCGVTIVESLKARIVSRKRSKGIISLISSSASSSDEHAEGVLNAEQGLVGKIWDDICLVIDTIKMELSEMNIKLNVTYHVVANQPVNLNKTGV